MCDEVTRSKASAPGRLLKRAADVLASRRQLDLEIAQLVEQPLDSAAADRVRAAQDRAAAARHGLRDATAELGLPPWRTTGDPSGGPGRGSDAG